MTDVINLETLKRRRNEFEECDDCRFTHFAIKLIAEGKFCIIEMHCCKCGEIYNIEFPLKEEIDFSISE